MNQKKNLDQNGTKVVKLKRNQKSISCRAGNLPHEKITTYIHTSSTERERERERALFAEI